MIEIDGHLLLRVVFFVVNWFAVYMLTLMARFGNKLTWKSEAIAITLSVIPSILMFTNLIVITWKAKP